MYFVSFSTSKNVSVATEQMYQHEWPTERSTVALQANTAAQLFKKYLAFCRTKRSIIAFKAPLFYPILSQILADNVSKSISVVQILILLNNIKFRLIIQCCLSLSFFPVKISHAFCYSHLYYTYGPSQSSWFDDHYLTQRRDFDIYYCRTIKSIFS